jgi:hypothetical protein
MGFHLPFGPRLPVLPGIQDPSPTAIIHHFGSFST